MSDTSLDKMRSFIATYPQYGYIENFAIDYTDQLSDCAGLFPSGLVEVSRSKDVLPRDLGGKTRVRNQYNFALYAVFPKAVGDDEGSTFNAEWVMDFQEWVQRQSATGAAPTFGDIPGDEQMSAQNGQLFDVGEGTAMYIVQISATFTKEY